MELEYEAAGSFGQKRAVYACRPRKEHHIILVSYNNDIQFVAFSTNLLINAGSY